MKTPKTNVSTFERSKKRLEELKGFYTHLTVYVLVNCVLIFVYLMSKDSIFQGTPDRDFISWVDWNVFLTPLIWGVFLVSHALCVYQWKLPFLKRWEEAQIRKIMDRDHRSI